MAVAEYAPLRTASTAGDPHVPHDALAVHLTSPLHRGSHPAIVTGRRRPVPTHPASYQRRNKLTPTVFVTWVASSWALI
jgi:hypothetical protein